MRTCSGIKANGERCRAQPMRDSEWCLNHHPDRAEENRRRSSRGGRRGGRGGPGYRERAKGPEDWSEMQRMYGSEWTNGQLNEEVANRVFRREVLEKCLSPGFMSQEDLRPHLGDDEDVEPMKVEWLEGQRRELGDERYEVNGYDR
jgi:hypothetical protein